uniref:MutS-like protein n=1 Tax=Panagrolaimus sp. PS1159 TaxID=55785 RepID=A0AC35F736_9BILA
VFNHNQIIQYKLGLISFSKPGHFVGLIPTKNGWLFYDGLKEPVLLPLRRGIQEITEQNGTLNCIYYFPKELPKIKSSQRT